MYCSRQDISICRSGRAAAVLSAYRLSELEEVVGTLHSVDNADIGIIAVIGKIAVWLPEGLAVELNGLIGQRVAVLRLDGYRVRCLGGEVHG